MSRANATRYWLVWNSSRAVSTSAHRHLTRALADKEALRLAVQNPGQEFVVLKAVTSVKAKLPEPEISWSAYQNSTDPDDHIPF